MQWQPAQFAPAASRANRNRHGQDLSKRPARRGDGRHLPDERTSSRPSKSTWRSKCRADRCSDRATSPTRSTTRRFGADPGRAGPCPVRLAGTDVSGHRRHPARRIRIAVGACDGRQTRRVGDGVKVGISIERRAAKSRSSPRRAASQRGSRRAGLPDVDVRWDRRRRWRSAACPGELWYTKVRIWARCCCLACALGRSDPSRAETPNDGRGRQTMGAASFSALAVFDDCSSSTDW